jgi:predicted dehydrogenase
MQPLGFALVGLDHWYNGLRLAETIVASEQAELRWIIDANPARGQTIAAKFGVPHCSVDYRQALQDPAVQVVACFVRSDESAALCLAAAAAGKHLISTKPFALNLAEADQVVAAVNRAGVHYLPGASSYQFFAYTRSFKKWINEGRIGRLIAAAGTFHAELPRDWPDSANPGWFVDPVHVPGGAWIDHAIYYLSLFRAWFGAEVTQVAGVIGNLKYPDLAVEDYGQAILTYGNGASATISSTWLGMAGAPRQSLEFFGSEGSLVWDSLLNKVAVTGKFGEALTGWLELAKPEGPVARTEAMIQYLTGCIRGDQTPLHRVEDDRASLATALAFYEATRRGSAVAPVG